MIISRSATYGLRAVLFLAMKSSNENRFGFKAIAKELDFPEAFLGKVLQNLVRKGIISSVKGPNGGFYIEKECLERPLISIIEAIDGLEKFHVCGLGLSECSDEKPCPIHKDYGPLRDGMYKVLLDRKIKDFKKELDNGESYIYI